MNRPTRTKRTVAAVLVGLGLIVGAAACVQAPPDQVGLYYMRGDSDGFKFGHCIEPGASDDGQWNNEVFYLPSSLRTWNIAPPNTPGADSNTPITVAAAAEPDQPSGVQVNLWTSTNFTLNTRCDGAGSPAVVFWEKIGKRYWDADKTPEKSQWWGNMLTATMVTAQETASRSAGRNYTADSLVSGRDREKVQQEIATLYQTEIKRLTGGEFFCSPTFDRTKPDAVCGEAVVLLKDVDYTNPNIQTARDEKQAAIEKAAAAVAEAQGKVDAAAKLQSLYGNAAWVQLQLAQTELDKTKAMAEACAKAAVCTIGSNGTLITK